MESAELLLPLIQLQTVRCPDNNALWALRKAFHNICLQTGCWRSTVNITVPSIENIGTDEERVRIPNPEYSARISMLHRILHEKLNGDSFDNPVDIVLGNCRIQSGDSDWLVVRGRGTLAEGDKLALEVSIVPDEIGSALSEIPAGIVKLCGQAAVYVAISILCRQPKRPWTDAEAAAISSMDAANSIRKILADIGSDRMDVPAYSRPEPPVEG